MNLSLSFFLIRVRVRQQKMNQNHLEREETFLQKSGHLPRLGVEPTCALTLVFLLKRGNYLGGTNRSAYLATFRLSPTAFLLAANIFGVFSKYLVALTITALKLTFRWCTLFNEALH